jgi:Flp pilus assembly protein TadG
MHRRANGQSLVEFGIVALLFVLIMFAIVDFGLLLNGWLGVSAGARQGARQAAIGLSTQNSAYAVFQAVRASTLLPGVSPADLSIRLAYCAPGATCPPYTAEVSEPTANDPPPGWPTGGQVTMYVTAPMQVITPLVRPFFGCASNAPTCTVDVRSSVTMRYEGI